MHTFVSILFNRVRERERMYAYTYYIKFFITLNNIILPWRTMLLWYIVEARSFLILLLIIIIMIVCICFCNPTANRRV